MTNREIWLRYLALKRIKGAMLRFEKRVGFEGDSMAGVFTNRSLLNPEDGLDFVVEVSIASALAQEFSAYKRAVKAGMAEIAVDHFVMPINKHNRSLTRQRTQAGHNKIDWAMVQVAVAGHTHGKKTNKRKRML